MTTKKNAPRPMRPSDARAWTPPKGFGLPADPIKSKMGKPPPPDERKREPGRPVEGFNKRYTVRYGEPGDMIAWAASAKENGLKLQDWVRNILNAASGRVKPAGVK